MKKQLIGKRFYAYSVNHLALAPAAVSEQTITVASDSDFRLLKLSMFAAIGGAVQTDSTRVIPLATVQLTETSSGNQMFDTPIPISNVFGTGEIPFILPEGKLLLSKSTLSVTVSNISAATTYDIYLTFTGYREYYK